MKKLTYKNLLAIFFIVVLVVTGIITKSFTYLYSMTTMLFADEPLAENPEETGVSEPKSVSELEEQFLEDIPLKNELIDYAGDMQKTLGMKDLYGEEGIYVTKDMYIEAAYPYTTTDYEYNEVKDFAEFLNSNGVNFMFVNQPTKYLDDQEFIKEFGVETYSNRNADKLIERLREDDIFVLDLREQIVKEGLNIRDMFYRTDHHWNVPTGLWAAKEMATAMNEHFGYNIDTSYYDEENFEREEYKEVWLGEQGKKLALSYIGLDDFVCLSPAYETSYMMPGDYDDFFESDFSYFIQRGIMNPDNDVYENYSWHYVYARVDVTNNYQPESNGNVLLICDSYEQTAEPFLSLGLYRTNSIILRDMGEDFDLRQYILDNGYDMVMVTYAQSWIGAHDDPENGNYCMFDFE